MKTFVVSLGTAALFFSAPASAAEFIFNTTYNGSAVTLDSGSDNPLTAIINSGDTFTYTLKAAPGFAWTSLSNSSGILLGALVGNYGSFTIDYSLDFLLGGNTVFSQAGSESSCCAHLGPFSAPVTTGLSLDTLRLTATRTQGSGGPAFSLAPFNGTPDKNSSYNFSFSAVSAVPEPSTWALMLLGFGLVGGAMRSKRRQKFAHSFA